MIRREINVGSSFELADMRLAIIRHSNWLDRINEWSLFSTSRPLINKGKRVSPDHFRTAWELSTLMYSEVTDYLIAKVNRFTKVGVSFGTVDREVEEIVALALPQNEQTPSPRLFKRSVTDVPLVSILAGTQIADVFNDTLYASEEDAIQTFMLYHWYDDNEFITNILRDRAAAPTQMPTSAPQALVEYGPAACAWMTTYLRLAGRELTHIGGSLVDGAINDKRGIELAYARQQMISRIGAIYGCLPYSIENDIFAYVGSICSALPGFFEHMNLKYEADPAMWDTAKRRMVEAKRLPILARHSGVFGAREVADYGRIERAVVWHVPASLYDVLDMSACPDLLTLYSKLGGVLTRLAARRVGVEVVFDRMGGLALEDYLRIIRGTDSPVEDNIPSVLPCVSICDGKSIYLDSSTFGENLAVSPNDLSNLGGALVVPEAAGSTNETPFWVSEPSTKKIPSVTKRITKLWSDTLRDIIGSTAGGLTFMGVSKNSACPHIRVGSVRLSCMVADDAALTSMATFLTTPEQINNPDFYSGDESGIRVRVDDEWMAFHGWQPDALQNLENHKKFFWAFDDVQAMTTVSQIEAMLKVGIPVIRRRYDVINEVEIDVIMRMRDHEVPGNVPAGIYVGHNLPAFSSDTRFLGPRGHTDARHLMLREYVRLDSDPPSKSTDVLGAILADPTRLMSYQILATLRVIR